MKTKEQTSLLLFVSNKGKCTGQDCCECYFYESNRELHYICRVPLMIKQKELGINHPEIIIQRNLYRYNTTMKLYVEKCNAVDVLKLLI